MPTPKEFTNASMAFLAYTGESIKVDPTTVFQIASQINQLLPTYPNLNNDWQIIWGPALYSSDELDLKQQANLTFVAQSRSTPTSYIVATRGTVGDNIWEWLSEDLEADLLPWPTPSALEQAPFVSKATTDALTVVLSTIPPTTVPAGYSPLPGAGTTLADFLASLTGKGAIEICFTGHSLGGAIAPGLALWFKQAQGAVTVPLNDIYYPMPAWDVNTDASISCVSLAGPTPGNQIFSRYFGDLLKDTYDRIYNTNDAVPHGFAELGQLEALYEPSISMTDLEKAGLDAFRLRVIEEEVKQLTYYANLPNSKPFTCALNPADTTYPSQALYQHINAYELQFNLPIAS